MDKKQSPGKPLAKIRFTGPEALEIAREVVAEDEASHKKTNLTLKVNPAKK